MDKDEIMKSRLASLEAMNQGVNDPMTVMFATSAVAKDIISLMCMPKEVIEQMLAAEDRFFNSRERDIPDSTRKYRLKYRGLIEAFLQVRPIVQQHLENQAGLVADYLDPRVWVDDEIEEAK